MSETGEHDAEIMRAKAIAGQLVRRADASNRRQLGRIQHLYRLREADPTVGPRDEKGNLPPNSPFDGIELYQSISPQRDAQRLVGRLCENHWQTDVKAPDKLAGAIKEAASNAASIFNSWGLGIEERTATNWQQAMSWWQCQAPYAVLHYRRCEDLWPDIEYDWRDEAPKGKEKDYALYSTGEAETEEGDCPECGGTGLPVQFAENNKCPTCEGTGKVATEKAPQKRYRETGAKYLQRRNRAYAKAGAPWHVQFIDPLNFVPEFDNDPRGGLKRALMHFDVSLLDYEDAAGHHNKDAATQILTAAPAPGSERGDLGSFTFSTPSSSDYQRRVHVWQLWDREWYYEWASDTLDGERELKKCFRHGYPGVPIRLVPAWDTYNPDPQIRFNSAIELSLEIKPFFDRLFTFLGAIVELTAIPQLERSFQPGKAPFLGPGSLTDDGVPRGEQAGSAADQNDGATLTQLQIQLPTSAPQFLAQLMTWVEEARPDTGHTEITGSTQPWAARLGQSQANVEPRLLLTQQQDALTWLFKQWLAWHQMHPETPLIAYGRDDNGDMDRSNAISVQPLHDEQACFRCQQKIDHDPEEDKEAIDFDLFDLAVVISPTSSAEKITEVEHKIAWATPDPHTGNVWIQREEVWEAMGKRNPREYGRVLDAERLAAPYKDKIMQAQIAYQVANSASVIYGPDGEFLSQINGPQDPRQVLQSAGWTPVQQPPNSMGGPPAPGGAAAVQAPNAGMMRAMPGLGALSVPGQTALPGVV